MTKDEALALALEAHQAMREWIDAVPDDTMLPAMPGCDRDWLDTVEANLKKALALDKMADNARDLGLDYEPVLKDNSNYRLDPPVAEPVVFYRCNGCGHAYEQVHPTSCDCMESGGFDRVEYYTTPLAAAPVEDVDWKEQYEKQKRRSDMWVAKYEKDIGPIEYAAPAAAQPAPVPDAIHHTDLSESLEYIQGWNDCRQAMLEMMK
jgi:hypothetical protein